MHGYALIFLLAIAPTAPVEFDTEVLPILAKAGCNAGACHGAAAGRGGFKLSLFGGDPVADHRAIVHELEGRRVNLSRPERSLLILKPAWQLDHEGGERFAADSREATVLLNWVKAGALRQPSRRLVAVEVAPQQSIVERLPAELALGVTAKFDDGTSREITDLAIYSPADPAATAVDERGQVKVLRPGRHSIVVRFLTQVQAVQVTAPYPHEPLDLSAASRGNWIDDEIYCLLAALRLPPSPRADDATLLRRVTLDLTGRLPSPDRIRSYLADENPHKFEAEVDRLLASPEFTEFWTFKLAEWLRLEPGSNDLDGMRTYYAWLKEQVAASRPLDGLFAELITASGDSHIAGPPNFHRSAGDARGEAEHVAETLLAIRLRCANCHNHPLDRWTQEDYHGLAAIFARLDRGQEVKLRGSGEVIHPATGEAAVPRIPGESFLDPQSDCRPALAAWLTAKDNPYFARAWVNRLWEAMFGRGLVQPSDDLRDTNPATHPELLGRLSRDFVEHGCDIHHTLRLIAKSAAYQRSQVAAATSRSDDHFYSHALARPLPQEVLLRAVCDATGVGAHPDGLRGAGPQRMRMIVSDRPRQVALDPLGVAVCVGQPGQPRSALPQPPDQLAAQLHWLNGPVVNVKLADPTSGLARLAASDVPTRRLIEEYYLGTVARLPTQREVDYWQAELAGSERAQKCEDFAWSLLSCREFVTNH